MKAMKTMKRFWFDKETGEFNWAIVAILALAAIFFYNVMTANVNIPEKSEISINETADKLTSEVGIQ
jgi:hypothetical protein